MPEQNLRQLRNLEQSGIIGRPLYFGNVVASNRNRDTASLGVDDPNVATQMIQRSGLVGDRGSFQSSADAVQVLLAL